MVQNYQDAMALSWFAHRSFVTFTCNSKWQEIYDALLFELGQLPSDRSDMIVRVFNMKVNEFIADIREGKTFGPVLAGKLPTNQLIMLLKSYIIIPSMFNCSSVHSGVSKTWSPPYSLPYLACC